MAVVARTRSFSVPRPVTRRVHWVQLHHQLHQQLHHHPVTPFGASLCTLCTYLGYNYRSPLSLLPCLVDFIVHCKGFFTLWDFGLATDLCTALSGTSRPCPDLSCTVRLGPAHPCPALSVTLALSGLRKCAHYYKCRFFQHPRQSKMFSSGQQTANVIQ